MWPAEVAETVIHRLPPPPTPTSPPLSVGPDICTNGNAGDFPCSGITLRKRVPYELMDGPSGSDIWGWFDALTGNEYALMGMENGTAFVDISNPEDPVFLGRRPSGTIIVSDGTNGLFILSMQ